MLGVGVDWAESFHDVALGEPGKGVTEQLRIEHAPAGVSRLVARCLELEPDPAEFRVVLETRHGPVRPGLKAVIPYPPVGCVSAPARHEAPPGLRVT